MTMTSAHDKTAIVTGGARGIGYAIAEKLCAEGTRVLLADISPETQKSAQGLRDRGWEAEAYVADLCRVDAIYAMVKAAVDRWGSLDILVNNAGMQKPLTSLQMTEDLYDKILNLNLRAPFFCCQAAAKQMREQGGGAIVNIASGNSRMVNVGRAPYTISKAGVTSMTAVLGAEWAPIHVRVNAVAPGMIRTALTDAGIASGALNEHTVLSVIPMERWGTLGEVADAVWFLAGDASRYITGQTLFVDGGWSTGILPNALDYVKREDGTGAP